MATESKTEVGSYFISNYPPFSQWSAEALDDVRAALHAPPLTPPGSSEPAPLGLYLHIPFCRKRCKFCYFRVYTDKNKSERDLYMDALHREWQTYAALVKAGAPMAMRKVGHRRDIYPVFRELFSKKTGAEAVTA